MRGETGGGSCSRCSAGSVPAPGPRTLEERVKVELLSVVVNSEEGSRGACWWRCSPLSYGECQSFRREEDERKKERNNERKKERKKQREEDERKKERKKQREEDERKKERKKQRFDRVHRLKLKW
ncbi:unnamed protein product [Pleuronectes platessa]|uniref:Uncharacterized protein n=1 Tax=Pleuronectes platessa TaxID=8262 RepID=A0A9N7USL2_PLEPL|nr:unnamed protein product [Pleuronectes platessa]